MLCAMRTIKLAWRLTWLVVTSNFATVFWLLGGVAFLMIAGETERYRLWVGALYVAAGLWIAAKLPASLRRADARHQPRVEVIPLALVTIAWCGLLGADRFVPGQGLGRIGNGVLCGSTVLHVWRRQSAGDSAPIAGANRT
jgi:hypothetical protein